MGDAGFFKGTSAEQDSRFCDKEKKLLKLINFPAEFNQKVNIKKVNLLVIKGWIANRIGQLLGIEDEVVVEYAVKLLEEPSPDPKLMQINLQGFLNKNTQVFVLELWKLLLSAQNSVGGIPKEFMEQTKEELLRAKQKREEELKKLKEQEDKEKAVAAEIRQKALAIREATRPRATSFDNVQPMIIDHLANDETKEIVVVGESRTDQGAETVATVDVTTVAGERIGTVEEEGEEENLVGTDTDRTIVGQLVAVATKAVAAVAVVPTVAIEAVALVEAGVVVVEVDIATTAESKAAVEATEIMIGTKVGPGSASATEETVGVVVNVNEDAMTRSESIEIRKRVEWTRSGGELDRGADLEANE
ncbi:hypothetical protein BGW38_006751 [Lunasporangiospora selenospora]|uniref:PWI domain-containing protein n=1 Tax=Lunasporangiospora selenospora TaxID=979761 RepID=A0A9P6FLG0_9FUNG|nr:hypothetical protein BGW38_006751 [Lunasporangiospora selenospora]